MPASAVIFALQVDLIGAVAKTLRVGFLLCDCVCGVVVLLGGGSVGSKRFEQARLTAELFFPDVHCPQGRLMKLTDPKGSVQGAQMRLVFVMKPLRSSSSARLHASGSRPCPYSADRH